MPRGWGFLLQMSVWLFVGLATSSYLRLYERAFEHRGALAMVGVLIVVATAGFVLAQLVAGRMAQKYFLRDNGSLLSAQTITLGEEGCTLVTLEGLGSSRFAWAAFMGRTEDERNVYLFLEPSCGIIIPKIAFTRAGEEVLRRNLREL